MVHADIEHVGNESYPPDVLLQTYCRLYQELGLAMGQHFFFQAEDGIRDYKVTGVQTCALPICAAASPAAAWSPAPRSPSCRGKTAWRGSGPSRSAGPGTSPGRAAGWSARCRTA